MARPHASGRLQARGYLPRRQRGSSFARPVQCDPRLLEHVWRNLLSNAAKFTRVRDPAQIQVEFRDGWFRIRDNGVGFDNSLASRMFRPFERLHPSRDYEGDGIGLALVSRVIERSSPTAGSAVTWVAM